MLIIPVRSDESIEKALKQFKKKFDKTKTSRQLRTRKQFVKPSVAKRSRKLKAAYLQRKRTAEGLN